MLCKICGSASSTIGNIEGRFSKRSFYLMYCPVCHFRFVANPDTDYANIYNEAYYTGRGPDPYIDYIFELDHPTETVRQYEWAGILCAVQSLVKVTPETRWLDYGCGNGGLVRYCQGQGLREVVGFEEGWIVQKHAEFGINTLSREALEAAGAFDVITSIEVIEHVQYPLEVFSAIRRLLKPGGLFFYTTGNAEPFRQRFSSWRYVAPEVHISFFEPQTLERALAMTGFKPAYVGMTPGFEDIVFYKLLKNLHQRRVNLLHKLAPRSLLAHTLDRFLRFAAHPIGWAV